jgi:hypothetical protein
MKLPIRAVLLATALTLTVAAPVLADPPTTTHVSTYDCFTVDTLTFCSWTETDTRSKEKKSGETSVKMDQWFMSTVVDANGNLVSSFEMSNSEQDTVLVAEGGPHYIDQNVRREDESTVDGVTTCTRYRILIRNETERINEVVTTPGPC